MLKNVAKCVLCYKYEIICHRQDGQARFCFIIDHKSAFDRGSFDQNSLDQNCHFSVDQNFHNQLTKIFDAFQLIEKFDQLPKKNGRILAVDRKFY